MANSHFLFPALPIAFMAWAYSHVSIASQTIEQVTIIGSKEEAASLPGSAYVIDNDDLQQSQYADINKVLLQVPGVYLRQEDGFGLRPNIGIRGAVGERNNKITVMEDNILIAPAPYAGPAAVLFPLSGAPLQC